MGAGGVRAAGVGAGGAGVAAGLDGMGGHPGFKQFSCLYREVQGVGYAFGLYVAMVRYDVFAFFIFVNGHFGVVN